MALTLRPDLNAQNTSAVLFNWTLVSTEQLWVGELRDLLNSWIKHLSALSAQFGINLLLTTKFLIH